MESLRGLAAIISKRMERLDTTYEPYRELVLDSDRKDQIEA